MMKMCAHKLVSSYQTLFEPSSTPAHLVLNVCVFEHQGQRSDVLPVHTLTASNLNSMFDAFVDLSGGRVPNVRQWAICKRGQDLQEKNMMV